MKVVKVTRKWRVWDHGHKVALRFNGWTKEAGQIESYCRQAFGTGGYWGRRGPWSSWYGKSRDTTSFRPYFISFVDESAISMILLMAGPK